VIEQEGDLFGAAQVEVVSDDALEEGSTGLGTVEDPGVGELDLTEGKVIDDAPPQVFSGEGRGQAGLPPPEEALHRSGSESIADTLEDACVLAGQKAVVELFECDLRLLQLALRPLVAVQVDPRREGRVGVGLDEGRPPLGVEQVEVEVVDHRHLASPLLLRAAPVLGALLLPRAPHRCLLLGDADEHDARLTGLGRDLHVGTDELLFGLAFLEVDDRDVIDLGEAVDVSRVGVPEFAERRRGRIGEAAAQQEAGNEAGRLEVGHVGLEEDPVDAAASERDPVPQ
jgi:hypothetical protein